MARAARLAPRRPLAAAWCVVFGGGDDNDTADRTTRRSQLDPIGRRDPTDADLHRPSTAPRCALVAAGHADGRELLRLDLRALHHRDAGARGGLPGARRAGRVPGPGGVGPPEAAQRLVEQTGVTYRTGRTRTARSSSASTARSCPPPSCSTPTARSSRPTPGSSTPTSSAPSSPSSSDRRDRRAPGVRVRHRDGRHRQPVRVRHAPRLPRLLPRHRRRRARPAHGVVQRSLTVGLAVSVGFLAVFSAVGLAIPPVRSRSTGGRRGPRS